MNEPPKKRDYSHLKKHQFKKGQIVPGRGRPKGLRDRKTELTLEILREALLTDPTSGKFMTAKQLRTMLSKQIWSSNNKVLLDLIQRTLGRVPENINQTQRVIFEIDHGDINKQQTITDDNEVIEGELVQFELESGKQGDE